MVGLTSSEAQKQLSRLGFTNIKLANVKSDRPKGEVVEQSVEEGTKLELDAEIVLKVSKGGGETTAATEDTEPTETQETKMSVRFTVPSRSEEYLLTILQDDRPIVEDEKIPPQTTEYIISLSGTGTVYYDLYIDGEKYITHKVTFD